MATTIEQQVALDEALVPSAQRLRIGRCNFRLPSDIQSKESILQVIYDVLRRSLFFKAFLVTADVPKIYMQKFWATAYVHQHSIRFKMDIRKNIVDLEAFREMLHISPRVPGQSFAELPFEEEILEFLWDDILFSTIEVVSRHQNTQQYGAILPIELTTEDIRNTKAYKEYYACATGEAAPKQKASARRKRGGSDSSTTPPTPIATPTPITTVVAAPRLTAAAKGKQRATSPTDPLKVERTEAEQLKIVLRRSRQETHISQHGGFCTDEGTGSKPGVSDVPSDDSEEEISWNSSDDEDVDAQAKDRDDDEGTKNDESDDGMESIFKTASSSVAPLPSPTSTMTPSIITTTTTASQPPIPPTPISSEFLQNLLTFESVFRFEDRVKSLEVNFLEFMRTNQGRLRGCTNTNRLQDSFQRENDEFLKTIDDDMNKIIKEQVKSQVKEQVTRILPRIEEFVNTQLKAEVLTRSSHSLRTSYAVAADLLEMELKKILIDKMEGNKSIQQLNEQQNLYKALVEAYEADKTILDSYEESAILKRRREDDDDQEGPSAGSDRGTKRQREGGEHASASIPSEPATKSAGRSSKGTQSRQMSASESTFAEEHMLTTY
uniref:Uncharacterized protein n=1 Tax=Tanacetum cinerariifolium TaxID=118510 RepID=A0A699ITK3_TANCI|nr:hypothetical protein [Tanacetum cinerariifolium]